MFLCKSFLYCNFFIVIRYVNKVLLKGKEVNQCKLLFTKIGVNKEFKNTYIVLVKIKTKHF